VSRCPDAIEIAAFADGHVIESRAREIRVHLARCEVCRRASGATERVAAGMREPIAGVLGDRSPESFADEVLSRLDGARASERAWARFPFVVGPLLAVAAVMIAVGVAWRAPAAPAEWTARGGAPGADNPIRHVLLRFGRVSGGRFAALGEGARLGREDVLAAEVGHTGRKPLFLLAFLVDAKGERHWIYPAYELGAAPPSAEPLPVADGPRPLSTMTRIDGPAAGPARLLGIVLPTRESVDFVESAPVADLARDRLEARYPRALVVETNVEVGD